MASLVDYHIARLHDVNPFVRVEAATELGLLGDPRALDALEPLFSAEPNPEVKRAIQEAGRLLYNIKRQTGA